MMNIKWALDHFANYNKVYETYANYYDGDHISVFSHYKTRKTIGLLADILQDYADNLMPLVVNTLADRLQLSGLSSDDANVQAVIDDTWRTNKLDIKSTVINKNTIKLGDTYVIVWFDKNGKPRLYSQDVKNIAVKYDDDGDIVEAVKMWQDGEYTRLTLYTPTTIERYISSAKCALVDDKTKWLEYADDGEAIIKNPYGVVPIFRFSNSADEYAISELKNVIHQQNGLNWSVIYTYLAAISDALPIRVLFGAEASLDDDGEPLPILAGPGSILQIPAEQGSVASLPGADLKPFLDMQTENRLEIARASSTPAHTFNLQSGDFPSGKALRVAEAPLLSKVRDRQLYFGDTYEQIFRFVCLMNGIPNAEDIKCNWIDTSPDNDLEESEVMLNKQALGVSKEQILTELGYDTEQIELMMKDNNIDNVEI